MVLQGVLMWLLILSSFASELYLSTPVQWSVHQSVSMQIRGCIISDVPV